MFGTEASESYLLKLSHPVLCKRKSWMRNMLVICELGARFTWHSTATYPRRQFGFIISPLSAFPPLLHGHPFGEQRDRVEAQDMTRLKAAQDTTLKNRSGITVINFCTYKLAASNALDYTLLLASRFPLCLTAGCALR